MRRSKPGDDQADRLPRVWDRLRHDLRQPLQALHMLAHLVADIDDAEKRESAGAMMGRLLDGVDSMLDHVSVLARADRRHAGACSSRSVAELAVAGMAREMASVDGRVSAEVAPDMVLGDPEALALALRGLLLIAMRQAGDTPIELAGRRCEGAYDFDVTYAGPAIPEEHRRALFLDTAGTARVPFPAIIPSLGFLELLATATASRLEARPLASGRFQLCYRVPLAPASPPAP